MANDPASHSHYKWQNSELRRNGKLVVWNILPLKLKLLSWFHSSPNGGHSVINATLHRLSTLFYWPKMKSAVTSFIKECVVCQRCKADLAASPGLLQPLPIPHHVWEDIAMDFFEGLPLSNGFTIILIFVDRLSKYGHFLALKHPFSALHVAQLFMDNVFKLHGFPKSIVSDRDKIFVSQFLQELLIL